MRKFCEPVSRCRRNRVALASRAFSTTFLCRTTSVIQVDSSWQSNPRVPGLVPCRHRLLSLQPPCSAGEDAAAHESLSTSSGRHLRQQTRLEEMSGTCQSCWASAVGMRGGGGKTSAFNATPTSSKIHTMERRGRCARAVSDILPDSSVDFTSQLRISTISLHQDGGRVTAVCNDRRSDEV